MAQAPRPCKCWVDNGDDYNEPRIVSCSTHVQAAAMLDYIVQRAGCYCDLCSPSSTCRQDWMGDKACEHAEARAILQAIEEGDKAS